jgi:hypothetical protein
VLLPAVLLLAGAGLYLALSRAGTGGEDGAGDSAAAVVPAQPVQSPISNDPGVQIAVTQELRFGWPAFGRVVTYFGPRHPDGIDISVEGGEDVRVFAAAPGVVVFAGGDPCCEYGYNVVVDHGNGLTTLYGRLASFEVIRGQGVLGGEVLGRVGSTGLGAGRYLHFELRDLFGPLDPLDFLPVEPQVLAEPLSETVDCNRDQIAIEQASFTRLLFSGSRLAGFELTDVALRASTPAAGGLQVRREGGLAVVVDTPPGAAKAGAADEYTLAVTLSRGSETVRIQCMVLVSFFTGAASPPADGATDAELVRQARAEAAARAAAAAAATATAAAAPATAPQAPPPPTPTPTRTPRPTATATATRAPHPLTRTATPVPEVSSESAPVANTPGPGPQPLTPRPGPQPRQQP